MIYKEKFLVKKMNRSFVVVWTNKMKTKQKKNLELEKEILWKNGGFNKATLFKTPTIYVLAIFYEARKKKTVIQLGYVNGYAEWKKDEHMENEYENYTGV